MAIIYSVGRRSSSNSQSLLQNSYFIAAVAIVLALVILRIVVLRWRNQQLSDFFRISRNSQYAYGSHPPNDTSHGSMYHGLQLAPVPAAYHPDRRVRAADIDAGGRRLGPTGENWDGKDALPVYDGFDRPPKYVEAGWTHGGPSLPMEPSTFTASPEGEQSRTAHSNTAENAPIDNTHDIIGAAHTGAPPPPIYHDVSGS